MKIEIYFDVYPWMSQGKDILPYSNPTYMSQKDKSATRYKVEVEIPDPYQVDIEIKQYATEVKE